MKNKKGFTLIELLAVIIILAIIALVAIPIILNMIEQAKKGAARDTAYGYIEAIEYNNGFADIDSEKYMKIPDNDEDKEFYTVEELKEYNIKYRGKGPDNGVVTISRRKVSSASLCIGKYKVDYNGKEVTNIEKANNCRADGEDVEEIEVVVPDETPCVLATETKDNKEYVYIDSAEDLYAFSASVNGGNDYSGKTVLLRNNIDLSDYTSDKKTKVCTDNDNSNGFTPIGNTTNKFKGNFEGGGKTISNITINRPSNSYVGLFGVVSGSTIKGLTLDTTTVKGYSGTGTLVGYAIDADIYEIVVKDIDVTTTGTESGHSNTGGLVGILARDSASVSKIHDVAIRGGSVTATRCSTGGELGRIFGSESDFGTRFINEHIVIEDVNVTTSCSNGGDRGLVSPGGWIAYNSNAQFSTSSKLNGSSQGGFNPLNNNDINFYEALGLDTLINGDDNESGYYFDYNKDGEIIIVSTIDKPIPKDSSFKKDGDYLLIKNDKDWRKAAALANKNKKFKLASNINFENKKYYMMGSYYHPFKGEFEGGAKKISNVAINADTANYIGMFGSTKEAKIKGLTIDNITVNGYSGSGSLVGRAIDSEVSYILAKDISVKTIGSEDGQSNTGGLVGILGRESASSSQIHDIIMRSGTVTATRCSTGGELGRIAGSESDFGTRFINKNIIVEDISITTSCNNGGDRGVISPTGWIAYYSNAQNSVKSKINNSSAGGFAEANINDLNFYEAVGLDTWINGADNDPNYYFDYNNGTVALYSAESNPLPTDESFEKDGDYLLIENETDWKNATALVSKNKKFKLTENLNFSSNKYYMMGSTNHPFKGTLNGNAKKISNVTINANTVNYVGMFGAMKDSKVYALQTKNITVKGYSGTGSLAGYVNDSEVAEILADNIIVTTTGTESYQSNTGGLVGILTRQDTESAKIHDVLIRNVTVSGASCSVGGELGRIAGSSREFGSKYKNENIIVENANVTTNCSNGGDRGIISPPTDGWLGYYSNGYFSDDSRLNNTSHGGFASSNKNNLSYYRGKIETMYDGDSNGTGYFFDYVEDGKVGLVKAYTTTSGSTAVTQKVGYTKDTGDDKTAPICTLNHVIVISNGFEYSFSCTDDVEIDKITSLFDHDPYNGQYNSSSWSTLGTEKNGTKSNSNKTSSYTSRWTTANSNPPQKGTCYYFSFGGKDKAGNYSGYHSNNCYQY